jgi:hypothetical protein
MSLAEKCSILIASGTGTLYPMSIPTMDNPVIPLSLPRIRIRQIMEIRPRGCASPDGTIPGATEGFYAPPVRCDPTGSPGNAVAPRRPWIRKGFIRSNDFPYNEYHIVKTRIHPEPVFPDSGSPGCRATAPVKDLISSTG